MATSVENLNQAISDLPLEVEVKNHLFRLVELALIDGIKQGMDAGIAATVEGLTQANLLDPKRYAPIPF